MLDYLFLLTDLIRAAFRSRRALVAENLLLRQQLTVLARPTRKRARLRLHHKLFWVLARRTVDGWRRPTFQIVSRRPCGTMGVRGRNGDGFGAGCR